MVSIPFRSNDRDVPQTLIPIISIMATRLDQVVYSPNCHIKIFRHNFSRSGPCTRTIVLKVQRAIAMVWVGPMVWKGGWCYVWILCLDGGSWYLCIVLGQGGYLHILGGPSIQSCCTISISASYCVFVCGR